MKPCTKCGRQFAIPWRSLCALCQLANHQAELDRLKAEVAADAATLPTGNKEPPVTQEQDAKKGLLVISLLQFVDEKIVSTDPEFDGCEMVLVMRYPDGLVFGASTFDTAEESKKTLVRIIEMLDAGNSFDMANIAPEHDA